MKTTRGKRASVVVCRQSGLPDLITALEVHLALNDMPPHFPLFSYRSGDSWAALTRKKFLFHCNMIWGPSPLPITGHCFQIGGTTELLLGGIPPHIVKALGCWSSDAFLRYWRSTDSLAHIHVELLGSPSSDSAPDPLAS
jgi:hypothetical protein